MGAIFLVYGKGVLPTRGTPKKDEKRHNPYTRNYSARKKVSILGQQYDKKKVRSLRLR